MNINTPAANDLTSEQIQEINQKKLQNFFNDFKNCISSAEQNGIPPDAIYMQLAFWSHVFMTGIVSNAQAPAPGEVVQ